MPIEIKVPSVGESIAEVEIGQWLKQPGQPVREGETLAVLESEKATVDLPAPASGTLISILKPAGQVAAVGEVIAVLDSIPSGSPSPEGSAPAFSVPVPPPTPTEKVMPAAARVLAEAGLAATDATPSGPGGRLLKEDAQRAVEARKPAPPTGAPAEAAPVAKPAPTPRPPTVPNRSEGADATEEVVRMSRLRRTVAARLVQAKTEMALLTTFNEVDMSAVMTLRKEIQESFQARHGVKLGFMSFFVKAVVDGLRLVPQLNAEIRGDDIVYKHYFDIGVAIGGGKGLVVPVLRHAERLSFAGIEKAIVEFATRAKDGKLMPAELEGGSFTISNGGVYGSLLSTPIVNPPQSGVLGMHTIQERPIALNGQVVIRPMMYIALTYDHRIVDGREAVIFLKRVKDVIENPSRLLLEA
jgi:2-oxoglutarate dehydrogenase E2 component (dihydrolipoamide succinyltransferase)